MLAIRWAVGSVKYPLFAYEMLNLGFVFFIIFDNWAVALVKLKCT